MKRARTLLMVLAFVFYVSPVLAYDIGPRMMVNDAEVKVGANSVWIGEVAYYPVRLLCWEIGAMVRYVAEENMVEIKKGNITLQYYPNLGISNTEKNGEKIQENVYTEVQNGRLFVPVEYTARALGCITAYDRAENMQIIIDFEALWKRVEKKSPILWSRLSGTIPYVQSNTFDFSYIQSVILGQGNDTSSFDRMSFTLKGICEGNNANMHMEQKSYETDRTADASVDLTLKEGLLHLEADGKIKTAPPPTGVMQMLASEKSAKDIIDALLQYYFEQHPPKKAEGLLMGDVFSNFQVLYKAVAKEYVGSSGSVGTYVTITANRLGEALQQGDFEMSSKRYYFENIMYNPLEIKADILQYPDSRTDINMILDTTYNIPSSIEEQTIIATDRTSVSVKIRPS